MILIYLYFKVLTLNYQEKQISRQIPKINSNFPSKYFEDHDRGILLYVNNLSLYVYSLWDKNKLLK